MEISCRSGASAFVRGLQPMQQLIQAIPGQQWPKAKIPMLLAHDSAQPERPSLQKPAGLAAGFWSCLATAREDGAGARGTS
ncbi:hypothetical protein MU1_34590 [Paenibacillus glycanilyticus]|uniref:Uncharacterized protein n=1 Tax=Paenibacillus glycanilyticus TaxID=126569 RepID=A0ABQ6GDU0_9BACL|nr:hypothetical protein MU1_34590 [Paenibacillus glycanilyticus]